MHHSKSADKIIVIDSSELFIRGTIDVLKSHYNAADFLAAQTCQEALDCISKFEPHLIVMDICLPETAGVTARNQTGMHLLRYLLQKYPHLHIVINSSQIKALTQINLTEISSRAGGFIVADRAISSQEFLTRVNWALQGLNHTKDVKKLYLEREVNPIWLELLMLAFQEGLQDKVIAQRICVSERMVRHYWLKLQAALGIDSEELKNEGKNIRILTGIRARELGLID